MSVVPRDQVPGHDRPLSIGELSALTGIAPATLRMWEERHGFPVPTRRASGHRRYDETDVPVVAEVARLRDSGLRLEAAIASALHQSKQRTELSAGQRPLSVHAEMLRHSPGLPVHRLRKPTLVALSHAIEDEFCARARDGYLFASFQRVPFFESARERWDELARVAPKVFVYADFPATTVEGRVNVVALEDGSPLAREWAVVCDATEAPIAMSAWEVPGQLGVPASQRVFETSWTLDPETVRAASGVCLLAAESAGSPAAASASADLAARPTGTADPRLSEAFFHRAVSYLDRALG